MNKKLVVIPSIILSSVVINVHASKRPNVIIIMTDQQRADISQREGYPLDLTPYVDRLADDNVWFNRAYTSSPSSAPARVSMLTGRFPSASDVRTNFNLGDVNYHKDIVDVLKEVGYKTAMIGKNHSHLKSDKFDFWSSYSHWGKDIKTTDREREITQFLQDNARGYLLEPSPIKIEEQNPTTIVDQTIEWINSLSSDDPFFAWVSFPEPHNPYQVCEPYYSMFIDEMPSNVNSRKDLNKKSAAYKSVALLEDATCPDLENNLTRIRANYAGMVRLIDDQLKRLIESTKESGIYEDTIFVILSDHGDYSGEFGLIRKGAGVSDLLTRIPFVWAGYGIQRQDKVCDAHVSIVDVFPTICTAIGVEIPEGVQGRSLWGLLSGDEYPKDEFSSIVVEQGAGGEFIEDFDEDQFRKYGTIRSNHVGNLQELNRWTQSGTLRMVREGDWKLVMDSRGRGELYNLKSDAFEQNNLYDQKKYNKWVNKLTKSMLVWELNLQDPLPYPKGKDMFKRDSMNYYTVDK